MEEGFTPWYPSSILTLQKVVKIANLISKILKLYIPRTLWHTLQWYHKHVQRRRPCHSSHQAWDLGSLARNKAMQQLCFLRDVLWRDLLSTSSAADLDVAIYFGLQGLILGCGEVWLWWMEMLSSSLQYVSNNQAFFGVVDLALGARGLYLLKKSKLLTLQIAPDNWFSCCQVHLSQI